MERSLLQGTPWKVILLFSIPLFVGNAVQQIYHMVDAAVVGQVLGVNSLAAVGATGSLTMLLIGFVWGMTSGFAIPLAQSFGANDSRGIRQSIAAGTYLTIAFTVVLAILAPFISRPLLKLMRTPDLLLDEATTFTFVCLVAAGVGLVFSYLVSIVRAVGKSTVGLAFAVVSCVLNAVFVWVIVAELGYGVGGAACATVLAQTVTAVLILAYIKARIPELHMAKSDWIIDYTPVRHHLRIGVPMGLQMSIIAIGTLLIQVQINQLGANYVAAFTTATRVTGFAGTILMAVGMGVSTYVAQNYGARHHARIVQGVRQSLVLVVIMALALSVLVMGLGEHLVRMFVGAEATDVIPHARDFLLIEAIFFGVLGILYVTRGALQGVGRTAVPTLAGAMELAMRAFAALILVIPLGFLGVAWSGPLAWIGAALLLVPAWRAEKRKLLEASSMSETRVTSSFKSDSLESESTDESAAHQQTRSHVQVAKQR